jgi:hypothetical protein
MFVDNIATADGFTLVVSLVEDLFVEKPCLILGEGYIDTEKMFSEKLLMKNLLSSCNLYTRLLNHQLN